MATFNQRVNLHSDKAKCCLATFNQHYHFACKNALGHFHPLKHFAISSMCRKAKSPVTVCGNSRNVTFCSLERQNRKWPLSATDPAGIRAASATHSRPRTSVTMTPSCPRVSAIAAPTGTEELPGCPRQPADPDLPISPGQPPLALVCYAGYGRVSTLTLQNCLLPYRYQQSFSNRHYSGPPRTPRKMPSLLANAHDAPSPTSSPGWRPGISTWPFAWTPTHTWHKS